MKMNLTIQEIKKLREKEDKVEFKQARNNYSITGGQKTDYKERRKCVIGYVVALANEGGGKLIFGVEEKHPENIVIGSSFAKDREGELEETIYREKRIRVKCCILFDKTGKRVLVIEVPSRPIGKVYTFEDIPLMRVGDRLERMSDSKYLSIVQEQEPDFSSEICEKLTIEDLETNAINLMKRAYSKKQNNQIFLTLNIQQILSDLGLIRDEKHLTYAALILLGKQEVIKKNLPQSAIHLEFRGKKGQIIFDKRDIFLGPYFVVLESLWEMVDGRNGVFPVQEGPYIFDIPYFNQETIREAINNAVAHRDYRFSSEVLIKQYPNHISITSPGGFPKGVTLQNLLTVNSTPRNRLLTDVLAKTGIVERSGQGVDKIFYQCLSEAKGEPDYSKSDDYQVELHLPGIVQDKAFALFITHIQESKKDDEKFSIQEIIALEKIRTQQSTNSVTKGIIEKLLQDGWIEKKGKTRNMRYQLSKVYYEFVNRKGEYSANQQLDQFQTAMIIMKHMQTFGEAKMNDFVKLLERHYTKEQIKYVIYKLKDAGVLEAKGAKRGTTYFISDKITEGNQVLSRAIQLGIEEMVKRGEISNKNVDNST